jgi:hypothetical protein
VSYRLQNYIIIKTADKLKWIEYDNDPKTGAIKKYLGNVSVDVKRDLTILEEPELTIEEKYAPGKSFLEEREHWIQQRKHFEDYSLTRYFIVMKRNTLHLAKECKSGNPAPNHINSNFS